MNNLAFNFEKKGSVVVKGVPAYGAAFTIDLWLKINSHSHRDYSAIFMRGNAYSANGVHIYQNKLAVRRTESCCLGTELEPITNLNINQWHRLTFTFDSSYSFKYYRDGVFIKSVAFSGSFTTTGDISIGDWNENYGSQLDGSIHDFKIFNKALNQEEVKQLISELSYDSSFDSFKVVQLKLNGQDTTEIKNVGTYRQDIFDMYLKISYLLHHDDKYKTLEVVNHFAGEEKDSIPAMNSDISGNLTLMTSGMSEGNLYALFDKNNTTSAVVNMGYIGVNYGEPKCITKYVIVSRTRDENDLTASPKRWKFEASRDGVKWITLDEKEYVFTSKGQRVEFPINNTNLFSCYRLNVTENNGYSVPTLYTLSDLFLFSREVKQVYSWVDISRNFPKSDDIISRGMNELNNALERRIEKEELDPIDSENLLDEGSLFTFKNINLSKIIDIRKITIK